MNPLRRRRKPEVAVLTMARDEAAMLPRWIAHYGGQVGVENLVVFDDNSEDGSTNDLPCTVHRLPPLRKQRDFEVSRMNLASGAAQGLLAYYDAVIFVDVDEFLVADPTRYSGLVDFIAAHPDERAMAPLTLNVVHHVDVEGPLDPAQPVLGQRRFAKFMPVMCKPALKRDTAPWKQASHGIACPFAIHRDLFMIHLKFFDRDHLWSTSNHRRRMVEADGRAKKTTWSRTGDEMTTMLASLVAGSDPSSVPEFDPALAELPDIRTRDDGLYVVHAAGQLKAMETRPLERIPERLFGHV